jgi:hypothetical protein
LSKTTEETVVGEVAAGQQAEPEPARGRGKRSSTKKRPAKTAAKKKQPKAAGTAGGQGQEAEPAKTKKKVQNFRRHAKQEISGAFPEIVHELIDRAKAGSLDHTKLLFDIGGVKDQVKEEAKHKERVANSASLADLLLHELERQHEAEAVKAEGGSAPVERAE